MIYAGSPTDKAKPMGFKTREDAERHCVIMNKLLESYETSRFWNKEYWPTKPEPWIILEDK